MTELPTADRMVAELTEKYGMRQVDIAAATGITQGAISLILTGRRKTHLFDTYQKIAALYWAKKAEKNAKGE